MAVERERGGLGLTDCHSPGLVRLKQVRLKFLLMYITVVRFPVLFSQDCLSKIGEAVGGKYMISDNQWMKNQ